MRAPKANAAEHAKKTRVIRLVVDEDAKAQIDALAAYKGLTISSLVRMLLKQAGHEAGLQ